MSNFVKQSITCAVIALLLNSCATILSGTTQTVHVQAVDSTNNQILEGASCFLTDGQGIAYPIHSNPGSVVIAKGKGALNPTCKKLGYVQKNFGVGESFNALTIVNILFWPGFIVDAVSGSMHKYPSHISVFMEPVLAK